MKPYAKTTGRAWFIVPTVAVIQHEDGEHMAALIWLNMEVGVRWYE